MSELVSAVLQFLIDNICAILFLTIAGATIWLVWQNHASGKVRSTIVNGLAVGVTAGLITIPAPGLSLWLRLTIVLTGTLATILINLKEENKKVEFPSASIYEQESKTPLEELNETYRYRFTCRTLACPRIFITSRMSVDDSADANSRDEFYFDVLFRLVVDQLYQSFRNVWDIRAIRSHLPYGIFKWEPNEGASPGDFIDRKEFGKLFPDSPALQVERFGLVGDQMSVPKATRLAGGSDKFGGTNRTYRRWFTLENHFVKVRVDLSWSGGSIGIGELRMLLGISQEESQKFWTEVHDMKLSAKFNRFRSGHPEMSKYKRWVNTLFEELQETFDTSRHIQRGREWYMLSKMSLIKE
jgi:hypothetical protein